MIDGTNLIVTLPLENEGTIPMKVVLEPLWEMFLIQPKQKVIIYGICNAKTAHDTFILGLSEEYLIVYAPGNMAGFIDCYMECDGVRLSPIIEGS